jgi:hypothetical protein
MAMTVKMYPKHDVQSAVDYIAGLTTPTGLFMFEAGGYIIVTHQP